MVLRPFAPALPLPYNRLRRRAGMLCCRERLLLKKWCSMAGEGKVDVEIIYCVPCGHLGIAIWMATEFFAEGDRDMALTLTPGTYDVLQVYVDGEKIYDKQAEQNQFPTLPRVQQMREVVRARLASAPGGR